MSVRLARYIRRAARALLAAGAGWWPATRPMSCTVPGGASCMTGASFIADSIVDARLRNDLGLLVLVDLDAGGPKRLEAVELKLEYGHTRLAHGEDARSIRRRLIRACEPFASQASEQAGRVSLAPAAQ